MRTDTVYELMREIRRNNPGNFENFFRQRVLGMTVLTGYNNKTYRIDDIDFSKTPSSTFLRKNTEVSIRQYYAEVMKNKYIFQNKIYILNHFSFSEAPN